MTNTETKTTKIFIYGTLMRGMGNDRMFKEFNPLVWVPAVAEGRMVSLGEYPMCDLRDACSEPIYGEVLEFSEKEWPEILKRMDHDEECFEHGEHDETNKTGNLYDRIIIDVIAGGEKIKAWAYTMPYAYRGTFSQVVEDGDWKEFEDRKQASCI